MQRHSHKLLMAVIAVLLVLAATEAVAGGHSHHGSPYYYANDTYYQYRAARREFVVTESPPKAELYAYPRHGQTEERQSVDRDDCHRWAVMKAGFNPTKSVGANHNLSNFRRAEAACLDARGYSVK